MSSAPSTPPVVSSVLPYLHPLDEFYTRAKAPLPVAEVIPGSAVPEPQRTLLVHAHDMTPTLEKFYGQRIHLRVMHRAERGDFYFREVLLVLDSDETPIEFGAIKINLGLFAPPARRMILEERLPLGRVLELEQIKHESRPKAYLKVCSDSFIAGWLGAEEGRELYGRRNTLYDSRGSSLAEIVEILPPAVSQKS